MRRYAGRSVVVGIRPESLEDAALAPEAPADRRLQGTVTLREALGSEIVAHLELPGVQAAETEDVRELARAQGPPEGGVLEAAATGAPWSSDASRPGRAFRRASRPSWRWTRTPCTSSTPTRGWPSTTRYRQRRRFPMGARARRRWPRWLALLAAVLALAVVAAACGGDDDDSGEGDTGGAAAEPVSGTISVSGVWTGDEQAAFRAVIDGFTADNPDATVNYRGAGDNLPTILATAIEGGNPPDIATVAQPGTIRDFVAQGELQPIEFARADVEANFDPGLIDLVTVDGQLYGVLFKAANKSLGWYNVQVFEDAGVEPPATFEDLEQAAQTVQASGVTPYAVGADIGWPLTDLFENIYIRTAGPEMYDQLAAHEIPWTDPSVIEALEQMRVVIGESQNLAGGTRGAVQTSFDETVPLVFRDPPEASMLFEGDFVRTNIVNDTPAVPGTDALRLPVPVHRTARPRWSSAPATSP